MIRQYAGVLVLAGAMASLQTTLVPFAGTRLHIDLLLVMVVIIGLTKDPVHGAVMSFLIGWLQDVLVGQVSGFHMTTRLTVFLAAQFARSLLSPATPASQAAIGLALAALDRAAAGLLHLLFESTGRPPLSLDFAAAVLLGTALNAILVPLFFYVFRLIPGFLEVRRGPVVRG